MSPVELSLGFLRGLGSLAWPWRVWVAILGALNLVAPLFFLGTPEARLTIAAIALGAMIQLLIFHRLGFVRLLGLGHLVVWIPLLPWLLSRLTLAPEGSAFAAWLIAVVTVDLVSLAIDLVDVARYAAGERTPTDR